MLRNRLSESSSPYLLQHQNNPVQWQEWSDEVLQIAKAQNKCLLISVGYSACHWCHVMAHECFEDEDVAALMNKHFINIKVDREERPDIDQVYMDAAQILTGRGGWPLNAFALPDGRPFYAGTYFPKDNWIKILENIATAYKEQPDTLINTAKRLTEGINNLDIFKTEKKYSAFSEEELVNSYQSWNKHIDFDRGGIDKAPKFPMPVVWESLLEYYAISKDEQALNAINVTLDSMQRGGIYDWVGGGFSRYSVDADWFAPHFEKMLYDNAQLLSLYADTYKITQNSNYKNCIKETINFLNTELKHENSGYYSALDADSEGEEGLFYTWTYNDLKSVLNDKEFEIARVFFGLRSTGNWEHGRNILSQNLSFEAIADQFEMTPLEISSILSKIKNKLKNTRKKHQKPGLDNKLITAHNAMLVKGFIKAHQALTNEDYKTMALDLLESLIKNSINDGHAVNRLMDKSKPQGFLDDYAFFIEALILSYEISFEVKYLEIAQNLIAYCLINFYDKKQQLFYYTEQSTKLVARKIEFSDNVIPSSNAVMAENLWRLGHLVSDENYIEKAKKMLQKVKPLYNKYSLYFARWHKLNYAILRGQIDIALTGPNALNNAQKLQQFYWPMCNFSGGLSENLPQLEHKVNPKRDQIFICQNKTCSNPLTNIKESIEVLKKQFL